MTSQTFTAEDRLGLTGQVCYDCNSRNPARADRCRRCGNGNLRRKTKDLNANRS